MRTSALRTLSLGAVFLMGCGNQPAPRPPVDSRMETAKEKIGEAAEATGEAARAQRDEVVREMQDALDQLNRKYDDLKERAAQSESSARQEFDRKLAEADEKRGRVAQRIEELKEAGEDRWGKLKEGVSQALEDLKQVFE